VTGPVRPPTPADKAWAVLAADLTPARSLARIDTVTARAVTTVTVIGLLLTGLGAFAAGLPTALGEPATALAVATVITAALAVAAALTAQLLTITRRLNPANLSDVRAWYHRQFDLRAYPTQAATACCWPPRCWQAPPRPPRCSAPPPRRPPSPWPRPFSQANPAAPARHRRR
jgi:hypothetical protein